MHHIGNENVTKSDIERKKEKKTNPSKQFAKI